MKEVYGKVINVSNKPRFITIAHQVTTKGRHYSLDPFTPRTGCDGMTGHLTFKPEDECNAVTI